MAGSRSPSANGPRPVPPASAVVVVAAVAVVGCSPRVPSEGRRGEPSSGSARGERPPRGERAAPPHGSGRPRCSRPRPLPLDARLVQRLGRPAKGSSWVERPCEGRGTRRLLPHAVRRRSLCRRSPLCPGVRAGAARCRERGAVAAVAVAAAERRSFSLGKPMGTAFFRSSTHLCWAAAAPPVGLPAPKADSLSPRSSTRGEGAGGSTMAARGPEEEEEEEERKLRHGLPPWPGAGDIRRCMA